MSEQTDAWRKLATRARQYEHDDLGGLADAIFDACELIDKLEREKNAMQDAYSSMFQQRNELEARLAAAEAVCEAAILISEDWNEAACVEDMSGAHLDRLQFRILDWKETRPK